MFATNQNLRNIQQKVQTATMNVLVDMYISVLARSMGGMVCISGVDFGCFSTFCGDCEALDWREEQTDFTLFCVYAIEKIKYLKIMRKNPIINLNYYEKTIRFCSNCSS